MSGITKWAELRENSLVEFNLDGRNTVGWLVKLDGENVEVRYLSEGTQTFKVWQVFMVETEVVVPIWGLTSDDFDLAWDENEEQHSYYGTRVGHCFWCWKDVMPSITFLERMKDNWEVPTCMTCVDPDKRPCQGCHQEPDGCICAEMADARSY
jgi:hypothetical protein